MQDGMAHAGYFDDLAMRVLWDEGDGSTAVLHTGIDIAARVVRFSAGGVWSLADVRRFHLTQLSIHNEARRRFGPLRIMMDLRAAFVAPADASEEMQRGSLELYRPEDRIAIIASSALLKLQLKRAFTIGTSDVFLSLDAAERWLQAD